MACTGSPNFAVTIVGFGMDFLGEREYFIIKNSFGTDWGEEGFARIAASNSPSNVLGSCSILS